MQWRLGRDGGVGEEYLLTIEGSLHETFIERGIVCDNYTSTRDGLVQFSAHKRLGLAMHPQHNIGDPCELYDLVRKRWPVRVNKVATNADKGLCLRLPQGRPYLRYPVLFRA